MNLLDPVKWGAQAAFSVTSTALKIGQNAVRTAELLLGRDGADDDEQRYAAVATPAAPAERPRPPRRAAPAPVPAVPTVPRGERRQNDLAAPTGGHTDVEPDELVESEGAADPGATLRVDAPWDGYDRLRAPEIVARVRESDDATKAVVRLYESTHRRRKSVLAATE